MYDVVYKCLALPSPHASPFFVLARVAVLVVACMYFRGGMGGRILKVAPEILCQVVIKLMEQRGGTIESRDLGRELNRIRVGEDGTTALSVIKEVRGRARQGYFQERGGEERGRERVGAKKQDADSRNEMVARPRFPTP